VTELDAQVGRILAELDALGLTGDTLVILASDHGEMLGDRWAWGSRNVFDAAIHLPLVMRVPGTGGSRRAEVERLTEVVDLAPTVLEWMRAPPLPSCDGASLLGAVAGHAEGSGREAVFTEFDFRDLRHSPALAPFGLGPEECVASVWRTRTHKYADFPGLPPLLLDLARGEAPVAVGEARAISRGPRGASAHRTGRGQP
jgi:arylsulfatase A-like enzyme